MSIDPIAAWAEWAAHDAEQVTTEQMRRLLDQLDTIDLETMADDELAWIPDGQLARLSQATVDTADLSAAARDELQVLRIATRREMRRRVFGAA